MSLMHWGKYKKVLRIDSNILKGQCHEIFDHFFGLKDSAWTPYEQAKIVSRSFSFEDIREKEVWLRRLTGHYFILFIYYEDTCWILHWLRVHGVSVVNVYADTTLAYMTLKKWSVLYYKVWPFLRNKFCWVLGWEWAVL